jgi:CubicO group peptidase (beta-lactamase class C family)
MIHGTVAVGFEEVRAEFQRNFAERGELGAACAVYHRGRKIVDLWGGHRDVARREPWRADALLLVYSTTKGMAAMALAVAHSRGWLDYEAPVASYWPEFAQNGKQQVTVRQLLAHQAGVPVIDEPLHAGLLADPTHVAALVARQKPRWAPGTRHGYHAVSLGWCEGELLRRVDPQHRALGQFFREEIARPLNLEFHFGLPESVPAARVAEIRGFRPWQMALHPESLPPRFMLAYLWPWSLTRRTFQNPKVGDPAEYNLPELRRLEIPAVTGFGQVRSIAKAYGAFANGGSELGLRPETLRMLGRPAISPARGAFDAVMKAETAYACGFMKPSPAFVFGAGARAFGFAGLGGSFGYADPDEHVGYAYAPNRLGFHLWDDPRDRALREALRRCLDRLASED